MPVHAGSRSAIAFALVAVLLVTACVPQPVNRPSPSPGTAAPSATATPVPLPTGPTPTPSFVRPTPTPLPTFLAYVVVRGDTLTSIARRFATSGRSIAYWNRATYPSLDPDSDDYAPNDIKVGWVLLLVPDKEVDPEEPPPTPTPTASS
jgi:hypothetical protein